MIRLTRLNGSDLWINALLIETVEATPDSVITMSNGHKYVVRDTPEELTEQIADFLRTIGLVAAGQKGE